MQSGGSALQSVADAASRFLAWWRDELLGLVPDRVRRLFADSRPDVVLARLDDGFVVVQDGSSGGRAVTATSSGGLSLPEAMAELARVARSKAEKAVGIRLPLNLCFARIVELPAAAHRDLRQILDMDLERATPFKQKDVYTGHVVEGEVAPAGKMRVRQLVTKRETVDPLVAEVKAAGLDVGFVDCWNGRPDVGMPLNFIEPRGTTAGKEQGQRAARVLLALAALLIVSALGVTLYRYESALAELQTQTAETRKQAAAVRGVLERSDAAVADLVRLQDLKLKRIPAIEVLDEVSRILPDAVWLNELRIEGDILDISGLAPSGAGLPTMFGRSAILTDAALTAPVTLDQREDKERFSVRVRVKHQAPSPSQAAAAVERQE